MRTESTARRERELAELASRQHGVVTRRQLAGLGMGSTAVARRLAAGRLHAVYAGVYLVGHRARSTWAPDMAAVLACGPDALVSHRRAALLWGIRTPRRPPPVEITVEADWIPVCRDVVVRRSSSLAAPDRATLNGIPVTSPARTILDLAAHLGLDELESVTAAAERLELLKAGDLRRQVARNRGRRGVARLRLLVESTDRPRLTRSPAERRLLALVRARGLPEPETNVVVAGHEVDALWPDCGLIAEVDGYAYHAGRGAFERDRRRDAELLAAGYRVIRVTWRQLVDQPGAVLDHLAAALRR